MTDRAQQSLSNYRLLAKIGEGGMGTVYRAIDDRLRRDVAIKFLLEDAGERRRTSFMREARLAAALNHPNICTIYEVGEVSCDSTVELQGHRLAPGTPFLVMELIEGSTLGAGAGPLALRQLLDLAVQIAEALAEAHARGIVHRDLKPGNVMVTASGRIKILDFGLAKALNPGLAAEADVTVTRTGVISGTPAYMSPEQARGQALDARSDIFSFGALLYELVAGRLPFVADSAALTLARILETEPEPLSNLRTDVPRELERIVGRCLRKRPDRRYNDTRDLVNSIRELAAAPRFGGEREVELEFGPTRSAFGKWQAKQRIPGLRPETCAQIVEYVLRQQGPSGSWPGQGDHWSEVKTACILKALAALQFGDDDRWAVSGDPAGTAGGAEKALSSLSRKLTRFSLTEGLVGEDVWDTCQVLLALAAFGRAETGKQYADEINRRWSIHYRNACESLPPNRWAGPSYLAAMGDVLSSYESLLEGDSSIGEILGEIRSLERVVDGQPTGAFDAVNSADENRHRWNTSLVLRSVTEWPVSDPDMIRRVSDWLLGELDDSEHWLGADRESPMYLARCLQGLIVAQTRVDQTLRKRIRRALERGNVELESFWSPVEAERTGDLKAYSAVLEYLAAWTLRIPAALVFGLTRGR